MRSVVPHSSHTCFGHHCDGASLEQTALRVNERLAAQADTAPDNLVARPAPSGRDFDMGFFLPVAWYSDRRRNGVLLFWGYLHDHWLRRCGAGKAVANARTNRRLDWRSDGQYVNRLLLPRRKSLPPVANGESRLCFRFRGIDVRRVRQVAVGHGKKRLSELPANKEAKSPRGAHLVSRGYGDLSALALILALLMTLRSASQRHGENRSRRTNEVTPP